MRRSWGGGAAFNHGIQLVKFPELQDICVSTLLIEDYIHRRAYK